MTPPLHRLPHIPYFPQNSSMSSFAGATAMRALLKVPEQSGRSLSHKARSPNPSSRALSQVRPVSKTFFTAFSPEWRPKVRAKYSSDITKSSGARNSTAVITANDSPASTVGNDTRSTAQPTAKSGTSTSRGWTREQEADLLHAFQSSW